MIKKKATNSKGHIFKSEQITNSLLSEFWITCVVFLQIFLTYMWAYTYFLFLTLFIYFWLHWVLVAARGFSSCGKWA